VRDAVPADDYTPAAERLIGQFRTLWDTLRADVPDVAAFMAAHGVQCPLAIRRLVHSGLPATVEHAAGASGSGKLGGGGGGGAPNAAVAVAACVQAFITAMDSLRLNMVAADQVHPLLTELAGALARVPGLPPDWGGRARVKAWVATVHGMPAAKELPPDDVRQLLFDLESSYNDFMATLSGGG
jgi:ESCRT-I complex subunit VPS28